MSEDRQLKLRGEDWSFLDEATVNIPEEKNKLYFYESYGFPDSKELTPFNLGIYYDLKHKKHYASHYVGIMPLLCEDNSEEKVESKIAIRPRFKANPTKMLETILKSSDFADINNSEENPIKFREFTIAELKDKGLFNKREESVLFGLLKDAEDITLEDNEGQGKDKEVFGSFIGIIEIMDFISKLRAVCQRMLKHQSQKVEENFTGKVKGKIDIQKQIRNNLSKGRVDRTQCVYNKLTIDNTENRILKYALSLCERALNDIEITGALDDDLSYCKRALKPVKMIKCRTSDFRGLKNNGVFKHYKSALESAKKILNRISVSFEDEVEKLNYSKTTKPFFIRMDILFELYCRAVVSESLKGEDKTYGLVEYGKKYDVFEGSKKVDGFIQCLIPDIIITKGAKPLAVIDAKYSNLRKNRYNREKTHQIMSYMLLLDCNLGGFMSPINSEKDTTSEDEELMIEMSLGKNYGFHIGLNLNGKNTENINKMIERINEIIGGGK